MSYVPTSRRNFATCPVLPKHSSDHSTSHFSNTTPRLSESNQYPPPPHQVLISIQHGTHHWNSATDPSKVYALSRGSIQNGDTYLTAAFIEQFLSIGWDQLFIGRIRKFWGKAYVAYLGRSIAPEAALRWSIFFITSV